MQFDATGLALPKHYYWDGFNFYAIYVPENPSSFYNNTLGIWRFEMNSQNSKFIELPLFLDYNTLSSAFYNSFAYDDGILIYILDGNSLINDFSMLTYYYWKAGEKQPYYIQNNNLYPTNMIGNISYSAVSSLNGNTLRLGIEYDEYADISFTK